MSAEVQQLLIVTAAVVVVVLLALKLGRRLKIKGFGWRMDTDRGRASMRMSATRGGSIEDGKQMNEAKAAADMDMTARGGKLKRVEQRTGDSSDPS
ncbi:MAG: hypothetical protein O2826_09325 [Chloroflexi bacterium]|nr:hypothetical protein [Acidobacteriota bacterium]MDA1174702.1 hypothetical protein [Chloroflexota bacterium]